MSIFFMRTYRICIKFRFIKNYGIEENYCYLKWKIKISKLFFLDIKIW